MGKEKTQRKASARVRTIAIGTLAVLAAVVFFAMHSGKLDAVSYVQYVENPENGLRQTSTSALFDYTLQYQPHAYGALMEIRETDPTEEAIAPALERRSGLQYFVLRIQSKTGEEVIRAGAQSEEEVQMRQFYLSTEIRNDLKLVEGGDTLDCAIAHFERNYGLAPYNNIVVTFENRNTAGDKTFVYYDRMQGGIPVSFTIQESDISSLPELKTR